MKLLLPLLLLALLLAGCAEVSTRKMPRADLAGIQRVFVEKRFADDHRVNELLVRELQRRGRTAVTGPLTMQPDDAQVVLSYADRWTWDFGSYLIEISLEIRDARTGKPLASAGYRRAPVSRQTPAEMVAAMLDPLFGPPHPGAPQPR
jgi:hypothetical protein